MEVFFTPEQEARLARIATKSGIAAEHLVREAALRLLEEENRLLTAVQEGIAQANRGEFIEKEEMDVRF
jgi:predicted transcriptional regulator